MDLTQISKAPGPHHLFGTDMLGRDLFWMIWTGGKASLFIGVLATSLSTVIAAIYGSLAGVAKGWLDDALMRAAEILMSVPQILLVVFLQAILGEPNPVTIAIVIGVTGWMAVAKMVRNETRQIRSADFVTAARMMGGNFFYVLRYHLLPNFLPTILFMIVTNLSNAIAMEATLSFLGIGLPVETVSWGSLLALSQKAMLTGLWWMLLLPGAFLVVTLICITNIGEYLRLINHREKLI